MKDQKDRKGMNNKGFSFVELIIAIAILAIMAGVLAPQLIKYIDSSRKSTDVQNAQAIATAVNIALANEGELMMRQRLRLEIQIIRFKTILALHRR